MLEFGLSGMDLAAQWILNNWVPFAAWMFVGTAVTIAAVAVKLIHLRRESVL